MAEDRWGGYASHRCEINRSYSEGKGAAEN